MKRICAENNLISDNNAANFHASLRDRTIEYQNKGYEVVYHFSTCVDLENNMWYSCMISGYINS